jgi:hypothetical protein
VTSKSPLRSFVSVAVGFLVPAIVGAFVVRVAALRVLELESDFAPSAVANNHLSAARAAEYHMLSSENIAHVIRSRAIRLIVFGKGAANRGMHWPDVFVAAGYRPVEKVGSTTLFALGN